MNTILWIFVATAFGLMLFVSLQDDIPEELAFLKPKAVEVAPAASGAASVAKYKGWTVRQGGGAVELTRTLAGQVQSNVGASASPVLGILCAGGKLDMRLDTRGSTTGVRTTPVELQGLGTLEWQKGTDRNVFPTDPRRALGALLATPNPTVTVSFVDLGLQRFVVDNEGLKPLIDQLPAACRP